MKRAMSIVFLLIISVGCALLIGTDAYAGERFPYHYSFCGENDRWKAEYTVEGEGVFTRIKGTLHYNNRVDNLFTLTYKGDLSELASVRRFGSSYETSTGGGSESMELESALTEKVFRHHSSSINGAVAIPEDIIRVTVTMDGKIEQFELKGK
jgi:hypothetical protein